MKQRIVTGVIAAVIFIAFLVIGHLPFELFTCVMAIIAYYELIAMAKIKQNSIQAILGALAVILVVLNAEVQKVFSYDLVTLFIALALILLIVTVFSRNTFSYDKASFVLFSALYIGFSFMLLSQVRVEQSLLLLLFILVVIWSTDSGAYFIGRQWGKHKLAPHISPNKTIEGMIGGIISALIISGIFQLVANFDDPYTPFKLIVMTLLIAIFGPIGDLAESALKRHYDVKDSGKLLPGHGGVLDRVDSWIFVLPVLYLFQLI
ncbi:phosphatidate cytidylyltransferase [Pullulanibacillus pueri]|uniref:Phosphatidate cytidylyltransferase n=1 Tax=Pullulanibacillus pueri TaxID=1437324 RepID=A0A8J2ZX05_9BACL|nr:phosphatidate cytidylyltransferase [Pullulanibacillus pueri]MBM7682509.1 phosphatidate cytidylyltransferase [Pullulanibacillus pueri]GGH82114.1 phosphatidate cytidylyltransferase [Pullulanibacillus pueri]